jgi:hypothetical protein
MIVISSTELLSYYAWLGLQEKAFQQQNWNDVKIAGVFEMLNWLIML